MFNIACRDCGASATVKSADCTLCRKCRKRIALRRRYSADPEKFRAAIRKWRSEHLDLIRERERNYRQKQYWDNPDLAREKGRTKARKLYAADPLKARSYARNWRTENVDKVRGYLKKWRDNNPDKVRDGHSRWCKENPEKNRAKTRRTFHRRRAAAGSFTDAEWQAIVRKQRGRCIACRKKTKLTVDHIVPISLGGSSFAFNLQGLCLPCNARKKDKRTTPAVSLFDKIEPIQAA